jgi:Raf kinase inhibitor-like YbhB/YbcL family protein
MRKRAAPALSTAALGLFGLLAASGALAGCNDDGRVLRPARPDQVGTVSAPSTSTTTVSVAGMDDGSDTGSDDGFEGTLPAGTDAATSLAPQLTAPFVDGAAIDARYTCDGANVSPALSWTPAPTGTIEIAITMVDVDALDAGPAGFVHWVVAGIDPLSTGLAEGTVPEFALQGLNSAGTAGYTGPCPPSGVHHYELTVHFLAQQTELADGTPGADLLAAVNGATFAVARLTGTYSRA